MVTLVNLTTACRVFRGLDVRSSFAGRLAGYLARGPSCAPVAVLLWNTARVHTLFMSFNLDLYFLNGDLLVLERSLRVRPFRFPLSPGGCRHVLEVPSFSQPYPSILPGDRLGLVRPDP